MAKNPSAIRRKLLFWIVIVVAMIGLAVIAQVFFGWPVITVSVSPPTAAVFLNDRPLQPGQRLKPGLTYRVLIGAPGYISQKLTIKARRFQPIKRQVVLAPAPQPTIAATGVAKIYVSRWTELNILIDAAQKTFYRLKLLPTNQYEVTAVSGQVIPDLKEAPILSPDFLLAIFRKTDGTTGLFDFKSYDLTSQEYHDWGGDLGDVAWRVDGQRLVYVLAPPGGERSLVKIDRDRGNLERIFDLRPEGLRDPTLEWSSDQQVIAMVSQGQLYFLDPLTKVLTKVISEGVQSAKLSPTSRQVAYTHNGQLKLLSYQVVDRFSTNPEVQKNIGRIIIDQPIETGRSAQAADGVWSKDGQRFLAIADRHVWEIFALTGASRPVTSNEPGPISDLDLSNDGHHLYVVINNNLYDWYIQ